MSPCGFLVEIVLDLFDNIVNDVPCQPVWVMVTLLVSIFQDFYGQVFDVRKSLQEIEHTRLDDSVIGSFAYVVQEMLVL